MLLNYFIVVKKNLIVFILGLLVCFLYFYYSLNGNEFCDCETTEKYHEGNSSYHRTGYSSRYYHK